MLLHNTPTRLTLNGTNEVLELFSDRVIMHHTSWLARWLPLFFGGARMVYLDEVTDVSLSVVRFKPVVEFRIVISSIYQADLCATCFEAGYATACHMVDRIEMFIEHGAFQPPLGE